MKKYRLSFIIVLMGVFSFSTGMAEGSIAPATTVTGAGQGQSPIQESASASTTAISPPAPTAVPDPAIKSRDDVSVPLVDIDKLKSGQRMLNVGHYNQLPPFYFPQPSAQPGFGHDILTEVAKKAGIQNVNFIGYDNTVDLNLQLQQGKIDLIANAWDLPGTRKQFLLTLPYFTKGGLSFLYFRQKGSFETVEDLKNHKVGVFKRGYADRYWLPAHGVSKNLIKRFDTLKELMFALKDGDIDVALVYYPLARLAQQQLTGQLDSHLVQPINDVYALRKQDTALQGLLDQAIQALTTDGTLDKIQAQYLE
jgi:ABC-type amino acid transport substrate-binding protein